LPAINDRLIHRLIPLFCGGRSIVSIVAKSSTEIEYSEKEAQERLRLRFAPV
jgi:hypothetical protein